MYSSPNELRNIKGKVDCVLGSLPYPEDVNHLSASKLAEATLTVLPEIHPFGLWSMFKKAIRGAINKNTYRSFIPELQSTLIKYNTYGITLVDAFLPMIKEANWLGHHPTYSLNYEEKMKKPNS